MQQGQNLFFHPFRFDVANERLWRRSREVTLRPKTFAVLRYLLRHANRLITKEELLDAIWPGTAVSDVVPLVCIRELRKALEDDAESPRYIETVPRRGYRFIAEINAETSNESSPAKTRELKPLSLSGRRPPPPPPSFVGRECECAQLQEWLAKAANGERQIIFISGEAGIGKTALVEAFLAQAAAVQSLWIAKGQCIEHYGAGEAYLPMLDALGRLQREIGDTRLLETLRRHAPTWLAQLPALLQPEDLELLQRQPHNATQERMLREMAEALETLTGQEATPTQPLLVLWLGDLHWSDVSTLDFLSFLARRRDYARLFVLCTYRPAEILGQSHPLAAIKQDLRQHEYCQELRLPALNKQAVATYLQQRLSPEQAQELPLEALAEKVHQHTNGNPLFMVSLISHLLSSQDSSSLRTALKNTTEFLHIVPENLRQMIERQVSRLSLEEQQVLEIASVAGAEFSAALIATAMEEEITYSEKRCTELARRGQFLHSCGVDEWPDGTVAERYGFIHALYQDVLYERLTASQRVRLHRLIGERKEGAYGAKAKALAAELAVHFAQGKDHRRAIHYAQQAASNAVRRYAFQEAVGHVTKGLELLHHCPETHERNHHELHLHMTVIGPLMALKGEAAPDVEHAYDQIWTLHQRLGETTPPFLVQLGRWTRQTTRGELEQAQIFAKHLLEVAREKQDPLLLLWAHHAQGVTSFFRGEFLTARAALEEVDNWYHLHQRPRYLFDPRLVSLSLRALSSWLLGYPDQARNLGREAIAWSQQCIHPYGRSFCLISMAWLHGNLRENATAQDHADALVTLASEHGFSRYEILGRLAQGETLLEQGQHEETVALLRQGIADLRAIRAELCIPAWQALLATAYLRMGRVEESDASLTEAEAIMERTGERFHEAELYRIKGELRLQSQTSQDKFAVSNTQHPTPNTQAEAEECFLKAIEIAQRQRAKSLELRAATRLARLWRGQGKHREARDLLAGIYGWFTEGFDTADLQDARQLLNELTEREVQLSGRGNGIP